MQLLSDLLTRPQVHFPQCVHLLSFYMQLVLDLLSWLKCMLYVVQIQFHGMTIYDCGPTYNPKHPESNPACTLVTNLKDTLRLQVSCHYGKNLVLYCTLWPQAMHLSHFCMTTGL